MIKEVLQLKKPLYKIIFFSISLSFLFALFAFRFERDAANPELQQPVDLLYFWVGMMTTVGHGFTLLYTQEAKLFTSLAMIFGTFMYFALFSEILLAIKDRYDSRFKGIKRYKRSGHVVIAGYNNLTLGLIHLLDRMLKSNVDIVLLASNIENNPDIQRIKFINDFPATTAALNKANIAGAKLAIIMSNDETLSEKVDLNTIIMGAMIEEMNSEVHTVVELSFKDKEGHVEDFNIDSALTFEELLVATRNPEKKTKILKNIPKALREELFKEEYV